jgi:hypothetical protein
MRYGDIYETTHYGKLMVIEYIDYRNVLVEFFETGFRTITQRCQIKSGQVKDKLLPSVFGVGFVGDGGYVTSKGGKQLLSYKRWFNMMIRCYSSDYHNKKPTYTECEVCEEWQDFQNFARWFEENYPYDGKDYHLDKDCKIKGNKIYYPESCSFIEGKENSAQGRVKSYRFISPDGNLVNVVNLRKFCNQNNLNDSVMNNV